MRKCDGNVSEMTFQWNRSTQFTWQLWFSEYPTISEFPQSYDSIGNAFSRFEDFANFLARHVTDDC